MYCLSPSVGFILFKNYVKCPGKFSFIKIKDGICLWILDPIYIYLQRHIMYYWDKDDVKKKFKKYLADLGRREDLLGFCEDIGDKVGKTGRHFYKVGKEYKNVWIVGKMREKILSLFWKKAEKMFIKLGLEY